MELTEALRGRRRRSQFADSCATPDHPMIDHLWRDRLAMADLMIALARREIRARMPHGSRAR